MTIKDIVNKNFDTIDNKIDSIEKGYWKSIYGKVKISEMDTEHLVNTIIYLEKNVELSKQIKFNELSNKRKRMKKGEK